VSETTKEPMLAAEDDPEFQARLAELYEEMKESIPHQCGKTENQPQMKHTLIKGSDAMTEQGILQLFKMLKGREATPQEIEALRAKRNADGMEG